MQRYGNKIQDPSQDVLLSFIYTALWKNVAYILILCLFHLICPYWQSPGFILISICSLTWATSFDSLSHWHRSLFKLVQVLSPEFKLCCREVTVGVVFKMSSGLFDSAYHLALSKVLGLFFFWMIAHGTLPWSVRSVFIFMWFPALIPLE